METNIRVPQKAGQEDLYLLQSGQVGSGAHPAH